MTDRGVVSIDKQGKKMMVEADTLVFATGGTSNDKLYQSLRGVIPNLFQAGDCVQPRSIADAIDEGMQIALRIS
jgi:predicted flavoprotein YhiN